MAKNIIAKKHPVAGFTLIELLVTIVIIGILVGIGVVSYNGIMKQNRQKDLENSLIDAAGKVQNYISKNNKLPIGLSDVGVENSGGVTYIFKKGKFPKFCIEGRTTGATLFMNSSDGTLSNSRCSPISPNIQTITKATCPTELTQVKDARDNNSYYIKKLADNQCWMLTNLAYAGGTSNGGSNTYSDVVNQGSGVRGTNTIYGPDNAGTPTYTEARYYIPSGANPTIDPTPPSTSTDGGVTNPQFGYLYNWCAAMGGQDTAACSSTETPAPVPTTNICPAGWRLPTGGNGRELVMLNTAINDGRIDTDAGLLTHGFFQYGRFWNQGFGGRWGHYWSSSQYFTTSVHVLFFGSSTVDAVSNKYGNKSLGQAVRCIAE